MKKLTPPPPISSQRTHTSRLLTPCHTIASQLPSTSAAVCRLLLDSHISLLFPSLSSLCWAPDVDADVEAAVAVAVFPLPEAEREEDEEEKGSWARASRSWVWVGGGISERKEKEQGFDAVY